MTIVASAALLLALPGIGAAADKFEKLGVYFEQTIEDHDAELMFEAIGGNDGLATLKVVAPDGRTVIDFKAPDSKVGMRQVTLETPEPKNTGTLQADFPEGAYRFSGTTVKGGSLQGEARLSHKLPEASSFVHPKPEEKNLPVTGLRVRWSPVKDVARWLVVIEHEASGTEFRMHLPAAA